MKNKKKIGIIGGMGPMATVELFKMIVDNTKSQEDQGHIQIYIDNNPRIPDRTKAILGKGPSPVSSIISSARKLEAIGADFLIMPCNTSHYFIREIQNSIKLEILNMVEETAKVISNKGIKKIGLLATNGTIQGKVYQNCFSAYGIHIIYPNEMAQSMVMDFIYSGVKANNNFDVRALQWDIDKMLNSGAQTIVLGCTELSIGMKTYGLDFPYIDAMEILAKAAIIKAGYQLA